MARLQLLGGPAEEIRCLMIATDEAELRSKAIDAHVRWLRSGRPGDRESYAQALARWARCRRDAKAAAYAQRLLDEAEAFDEAAAPARARAGLGQKC